jgi:Asp-tRNA(Asn)/Glu-tRNA(Gln) amidotransferase C subunit
VETGIPERKFIIGEKAMNILGKIFPLKKGKKRKTKGKTENFTDNSSFTETAPDEKNVGALQREAIHFDSREERENYIANNCEQIIETTKQLEELKTEYQAVTSYLADMQKIERIPDEDRKELNETAKKIIAYTKERSNYQKRARKITDDQFKNIARYEDTLPDELKKMKDNEEYYNTIKKDMKYLEAEKETLLRQREEILARHSYLKGIAVTTCILVFILFGIFAILDNTTGSNMKLPFLMTVVMAGIAAFYIFINSKNNQKEMKITELKLNRAIGLLNKVKIKYINKTNELDYAYQKHMVKSYTELQTLWEEYKKAKEEEKNYSKNMEELEYYERQLVKKLESYVLKDPEVWLHQVTALVDSKEMDEVRHRLEDRRKKLWERIEYNNNLKDKGLKKIQLFIEQRPENRDEVIEKLKSYGIYL